MAETSKVSQVLLQDRMAIDAKIEESLRAITNPRIRAAATHILGAGGKRIRPSLMMTVYKAVGGVDINKAVWIAVALELIHNWTLIHDDIIDKSDMRRGVSTVHKRWNETVAILSGDMLNNLAYRMITQSGWDESTIKKVLEEIAVASMEVIDGELLDVEFEGTTYLTEQDYFKMIRKKTGSLFSASARIGAILGTRDEHVINAMEKYGQMIGLAFQVQDDLLDITGNTNDFGKEIGKDIKEGKKTLMVIHALNTAAVTDAKKLKTILSTDITSATQIQEAMKIMQEAGSIDHACQMLTRFAQEASEQLKAITHTRYSVALEELASFITTRRI